MAVQKKKKKTGSSSDENQAMKLLLEAVRGLADRRLLASLVLYIAVCGIVITSRIGGFQYNEGDIADVDIISSRTVDFEDYAATEEERLSAEQEVGRFFTISEKFREDITEIFRLVLEQGIEGQENEAVSRATALAGLGLKRETIKTLLTLKKDEPTRLRLKAMAVASHIELERMYTDEEIANLEQEAIIAAEEEGVDENLSATVVDIVVVSARNNLNEDVEARGSRLKEARETVQPIVRRIKAGEVVVRRGDPITKHHLESMKALGIGVQRDTIWHIVGFALLILFAFIFSGIYIKTFSPDIYRSNKKMYIFCILIFLNSATAVLIEKVDVFSPFMFGAPVAAMTILISVLIRPVIALFAVPVISIALAISLGFGMDHFMVAMVSAMAAYYFSVRHRDKDSLMKAGVAVSISNMAALIALALIRNYAPQEAIRNIFVFGGLNGIVAAVVATGSLPAFEMIFNVTTPHRLLELSNPDEPLLKKMLINAPGTYYHSFFVGNLAESLADSIGANALLVRIACYYHDVGKLRRPYFFAENQIHGETHLPEMTPTMNSLVISAHLKDGVEMAKEHNLPDEIVDIISQHHGTMLISFFHKQAIAAADGEDVSEERFRYPGPKPQTVESAIVMLADSCEAAVRSLKTPTPKHIENIVNSIVRERVVDGQFQECNITLKQIDTLRINLVKTLANIYHTRMEYPDLDEMKSQKEAARQNGKH